MTNTIFIKNASYADVKKALSQWLTLYEHLDPELNFNLYEDVAGSAVIIKADQRLSNENFSYLVNYLQYPEEITYAPSIHGYTEITSENFFPKNLSGNMIMLFIPDYDSEYDNVYWVTMDNEAYITDMGGKTSKTETAEKFKQLPVNVQTIPADILQPIKRLSREIEKDNAGASEKRIGKRFNILLIIMGVPLLIGFIYHRIDFDFSFKLYFLLLLAVTVWFMSDYKMLQVVRFYNLSFIIAAALVFYGYFYALVNPASHPDATKPNTGIFTFYPLIFLCVQKPMRLIFKSILGREPVIDKPMPSIADFLYFVLLMLISVLGLLAIRPLLE